MKVAPCLFLALLPCLWAEQPQIVVDLKPGSSSSFPAYRLGKSSTLYFVPLFGEIIDSPGGGGGSFGGDDELWKTDGTSTGTVQVKDIVSGPSGSTPRQLTSFSDGVAFVAQGSGLGAELWFSNGTDTGTVLVKDIQSGANGSYPVGLTSIGSVLYFSADDGSSGRELWRSDGTDAGTYRVADINPGTGGSDPTDFIAFAGLVFFFANDGSSGKELWKTDGTTAGTVRVADIMSGAGGSADLKPVGFTQLGGGLYFAADDGTHGKELWKTDGTPSGTVMVKDLFTGSEMTPKNWTGG